MLSTCLRPDTAVDSGRAKVRRSGIENDASFDTIKYRLRIIYMEDNRKKCVQSTIDCQNQLASHQDSIEVIARLETRPESRRRTSRSSGK